jgi:hypothetical protein
MNRQWKLTSAIPLVLAALTGGAQAAPTAKDPGTHLTGRITSYAPSAIGAMADQLGSKPAEAGERWHVAGNSSSNSSSNRSSNSSSNSSSNRSSNSSSNRSSNSSSNSSGRGRRW